jgi:hypothetical protein
MLADERGGCNQLETILFGERAELLKRDSKTHITVYGDDGKRRFVSPDALQKIIRKSGDSFTINRGCKDDKIAVDCQTVRSAFRQGDVRKRYVAAQAL